MLTCPDCATALDGERLVCACGWRGEHRAGLPVLLSGRDRDDPLLQGYLRNYDRIAADDLRESIQDERYLAAQALNLAGRVEPVAGVRIADIGCGQGHLTRALLERGATDVTVVDISPAYLKGCQDGAGRVRPVLANAENLPFQDAFDVVVATDIMEHVLNLGAFLYSLNRALVTGGRAWIRVPLDESLLGYAPQLGCPYRLVHLRSFDRRILRTGLEAAGFAVERFAYDGFWLNVPRPFWTRTARRRRMLERFVTWASGRVSHPTDVTRWNSTLTGIFLRPVEVTVQARKRTALPPPVPAAAR